MGRVSGKVVIVTGGARGIGGETVRLLAAEGANVVIADLLDVEGKKLADELGDAVTFVHHDVTDRESWKRAVAVARDNFSGLDVLVNNAGIDNMRVPLNEVSPEEWQRVLSVNVTGVFNGIQAAIPLLSESTKKPSIVNISSTAGLKGYAEAAAYVTSKFAVRGLTKAAALDFGPRGVRVNSVHPGFIATSMTEGLTDDDVKNSPLGRLGTTSEIAALVVFLASDESSFSTGAEFVADGGEVVGTIPS
ncbi:glucose 1-dehydrogenase [Arthrobacter sp. NPDC080073]|uniref:glucose 1-dehydrogenase n=1 Tax=Arthrobacter sp. NPDC080073 TaxID=3155919 RepID=UPI003435FD4B